jgi:hypothetical protein
VKFFDLTPDDAIFHVFYEIDDLDHFPQAYVSGNPIFRGSSRTTIGTSD